MPTHDTVDLATYAERAYLEYAMSVVKGRALPDIKDGQKPVQRRILYAMRGLGLGPSAKPVKSARVVGEILGKYHPHGDSSAYEAMVRMAQNFVMRYPLVDGHGNFGSRDGDGSASMRYTECRLTKYADLVLSELESDTVVTVVTTENRVLSFFINELKIMAKGRGLQTIGLRDKATVTVGMVSRLNHVTVSLKGPRGGIATAAVSFKPYLGDRGRTGKPWTGQGTIIGISAT